VQELLKEKMQQQMLNAKQLSEKAGYHHNTVLAWLNGKNQPNINAVQDCLNAMGYELQIKPIDKDGDKSES